MICGNTPETAADAIEARALDRLIAVSAISTKCRHRIWSTEDMEVFDFYSRIACSLADLMARYKQGWCTAPTQSQTKPRRKKMTDNSNTATNTPYACGLSALAVAWVQEHGSAFLRFCVAEGIKCIRFYNEERVQKEAPGWSLLYGAAYQPDHPPAEAMELLARAREKFSQARLRQIYICVEDRDEDEYAAITKFVVVVDDPWPDGQKLVFDDRLVVAIKDE